MMSYIAINYPQSILREDVIWSYILQPYKLHRFCAVYTRESGSKL